MAELDLAELKRLLDLKACFCGPNDVCHKFSLNKDRRCWIEVAQILCESAPELIAAAEQRDALATMILAAHGKALPPNWVYTDSQTTVDLLVAEITTLRAEVAELSRDRERLDWFDGLPEDTEFTPANYGRDIRSAIDAARKQEVQR